MLKLTMRVLAIESSFDETAAAVIADGRRELSNVVASQADLHAEWGGVVPEVASRQHVGWIVPVVDRTFGLDETAAAYRTVAGGTHVGKVAIVQ